MSLVWHFIAFGGNAWLLDIREMYVVYPRFTQFNERTKHFIKIYLSHFILKRIDVSLVRERWVERHILRERILLPISSSGSQEVPTLAPPCKLVWHASGRLRVPHSLAILCTQSKSDHVVLITWSPSGYPPVPPECPDRAALFTIHNVTACQCPWGH